MVNPHYRRRDPNASVLHGCVREAWPTVRDTCESSGRPLPIFVEREFEGYLRCGLLGWGFARIHCPACGSERLVAFSCKGRGFCPSCGGRRMEQGAAWLCERLLPPVPLRQWVLSVPRVLRYLLAYDGRLVQAAASAAMAEVFRFQRMAARRALGLASTRQALPGALVAVQRFGSSLNLNVHFHALLLDGVYVEGAEGPPVFHGLDPPSLADLQKVVARIAKAVLGLLKRRGIWLEEVEAEDPVEGRHGALGAMAQASIQGTLVFGRAGTKPVCLRDAPVRMPAQAERAGRSLGFTLDAAVRVEGDDRLHRERLCRYLLRPPLAKGRLVETVDGKVAFELKTPWSDGTRVIFLTKEELVARLAALVPPPRMHLVHYYGVLAPNARHRRYVVPAPPEEEEKGGGHSVAWEETRQGKTIRRRWVPWAELLLKVFAVDVFDCPDCHSRMQRIAWITQPKVIKAILDCLERKERPP